MTNLPQARGRFGAWFRDARTAAGLSQADVARATGYSPTGVGAWEQGRACPQEEAWELLAETLGVERTEIALAVRGGCSGITASVVLPRLADPGRVTCETGCAFLERCKRAVGLGLPVFCEDVDERDVLAARQLGAVAALLERADGA